MIYLPTTIGSPIEAQRAGASSRRCFVSYLPTTIGSPIEARSMIAKCDGAL